MQGFFIGKAEDDLELIIMGWRGQHAGTQVTGEVSRQLLAFTQPGHQFFVATFGHAARNHQGDG